eukprot:scaffold952_cov409-Prasinococcus_capsulatus_cf.AAC.71
MARELIAASGWAVVAVTACRLSPSIFCASLACATPAAAQSDSRGEAAKTSRLAPLDWSDRREEAAAVNR